MGSHRGAAGSSGTHIASVNLPFLDLLSGNSRPAGWPRSRGNGCREVRRSRSDCPGNDPYAYSRWREAREIDITPGTLRTYLPIPGIQVAEVLHTRHQGPVDVDLPQRDPDHLSAKLPQHEPAELDDRVAIIYPQAAAHPAISMFSRCGFWGMPIPDGVGEWGSRYISSLLMGSLQSLPCFHPDWAEGSIVLADHRPGPGSSAPDQPRRSAVANRWIGRATAIDVQKMSCPTKWC